MPPFGADVLWHSKYSGIRLITSANSYSQLGCGGARLVVKTTQQVLYRADLLACSIVVAVSGRSLTEPNVADTSRRP